MGNVLGEHTFSSKLNEAIHNLPPIQLHKPIDTIIPIIMPSANPSWPERQTAIVANATGDLIVSHDVLLPELEPDMLLVKMVAVAVNPCDMKMTGPMASEGAISGGDGAGIVLAIGSEVPEGRFAVGDRVCVAVQSMNPLLPRVGAFAQYVGATADFTLKIPEGMTFEEAATIGISTATIGYALFKSLDIPGHPDKPAAKPAYVLVYGGSTATGTIAIQLIRRYDSSHPKEHRSSPEY